MEGIPSQTVPEPAPDPIMSAVQTVWHQMVGHGQEQLSKAQEEFSIKESEWLAERESLLARLDECNKALETLNATHHQLQQQYQALSQQEQKLQVNFSNLQVSLEKEQEFHKKTLVTAQEEKLFLEEHYQNRYDEVLKAYQKAQQKTISEVDNLKALMEQQRHEHVLMYDKLQQEYRQLQALHQQQQKQFELEHESRKHAEQVLSCLSMLTQQQNELTQLAQQTHLILKNPKTWIYPQHLAVDFYKNQRFVY